jgi:hypothetical protein
MERLLVSLAILVMSAGSAAAQPGQTPAQPPPPPPAQPGWTPTPAYAAPRFHLLSAEEQELLIQGEISEGAYVGGGLVGTFFAFGLGHLVQGRFTDKGWIFMAGEAASVTILVAGLLQCLEADTYTCEEQNGLLVVGLIGAVGFRIWELIDVWGGPPAHNARVREIRWRAGLPPYGLYLAPSLGRGDGGGVAGLTLRF